MELTEEQVFEGFMALPLEKQIQLRNRLDSAIYEDAASDDLERCLDLADKRYEAYKAGKIKAISFDEVQARVSAARG